jgi:hypothetical protein
MGPVNFLFSLFFLPSSTFSRRRHTLARACRAPTPPLARAPATPPGPRACSAPGARATGHARACLAPPPRPAPASSRRWPPRAWPRAASRRPLPGLGRARHGRSAPSRGVFQFRRRELKFRPEWVAAVVVRLGGGGGCRYRLSIAGIWPVSSEMRHRRLR